MPAGIILVGIGCSARALVEQAKHSRTDGTQPIAYFALSSTVGEEEGGGSSSLLPGIEDQCLKPVARSVPDVPCIDEMSDAAHSSYALKRAELINHLRLTMKELLTPDRPEPARDLEIYLFVDTGHPMSVISHDFFGRVLGFRDEFVGHNLRGYACLMVPREASPYTYFVLERMTSHLGESSVRGIYLVEESERTGERWQAIGEWLQLVLSGHHIPPDSRMRMGSFGLARLVVPKQLLERFLSCWLASALLKRLQVPRVEGKPDEVVESFLQPLLDDDDKDPRQPATGDLAPEVTEQQEHCHLYQLGDSPKLYSEFPLLKEIEARIKGQETSGAEAVKSILRSRAKTIRTERGQAIEHRHRQVLRSEGFERLSRRLDNWSARLADLAENAADQVDKIRQLHKQGGRKQKPVPVASILIRMALSLAALALVSVTLFLAGASTLLQGAVELLPLIAVALAPFLTPFLFLCLVNAAGFMITLFPYLWLRVRRRSDHQWQAPSFELLGGRVAALGSGALTVFLGWLLWRWGVLSAFEEILGLVIALWVVAILVEILVFMWPTIRLYELFPLWPPTETSLSYPEAEEKARNALGGLPWGLVASRLFVLVIVGLGILLAIGQGFESSGWEMLNRLLSWDLGEFVERAWFRDGILILAGLSLKYVADLVLAKYFLIRRGMSWPQRRVVWWVYMVGWIVVAIGLALAFAFLRAPSEQDQAATYYWTMGLLAAWAVMRFLWERWNDEARVRQLALDWIEWHDRMAYLVLHRAAWENAGEVYNGLKETAETLRRSQDEIQSPLAATEIWAVAEAQSVRDEIARRHDQGIPRFLEVHPDLERLYLELDLEALLTTAAAEWGPALDHLGLVGDSTPLMAALRTIVIAKTEEELWRGRTALDFLTKDGYPDRESLAREQAQFFGTWPDSFWDLDPVADAHYPKEVFVGLPEPRQRDIDLERAIGLLTPLPEGRGLPTFFEEDRWGVSAIFYQADVLSGEDIADPSSQLRSLKRWRQECQSRQEEYQRERDVSRQ